MKASRRHGLWPDCCSPGRPPQMPCFTLLLHVWLSPSCRTWPAAGDCWLCVVAYPFAAVTAPLFQEHRQGLGEEHQKQQQYC